MISLNNIKKIKSTININNIKRAPGSADSPWKEETGGGENIQPPTRRLGNMLLLNSQYQYYEVEAHDECQVKYFRKKLFANMPWTTAY